MEELRRLAGGVNPETGEPFGDDVAAIFETFLSRNVPSDDEAFYTIVGGRPFRNSPAAPDLFVDPQFLRAWQVEEPTTSTTVADVGEVRSLAVPLFTDSRVGGSSSWPVSQRTSTRRCTRLCG